MKLISAVITFCIALTALSQNKEFGLRDNRTSDPLSKQFVSNQLRVLGDSVKTTETTQTKKSHKSPGLAFIYSLLVPGLGHVYADRFSTGKYFMISEAAVWLTYAAFSLYGNWLLDDAYSYSVTHAGVNLSGKERDETFFTDIANYTSIYQYNDEMLRFGNYDKLYDPATHYFYWDADQNRKTYREDKLAGDRILNDRLFVIGAVIINHVVSAISAVFAANSYNSDISRRSSGGMTFKAGLQKHFNRIDGISLKFVKWF